MKLLIALCLLSVAALSMADTDLHPRGCIYALGKCVKDCEEGTYGYAIACGNKTPEPTCQNPEPIAEESIICDYSACYCSPPTVRHKPSGKCMRLEDCPKE